MTEEEKPRSQEVSRRRFLKTGATASLVAVVAGVGGFLSYQIGQSSPATPQPAATQQPAAQASGTTVVNPSAELKASLPSVAGATPAERAVNAIKALRAQGKIPEDATMKIMILAPHAGTLIADPEGQPHPYTGFKSIHIGKEFTRQTGIPVQIDTISDLHSYDKAVAEGVTKAGTWDLMNVAADFLYDYIDADAINEITPYVNAYNPEFNSGPSPLVKVVQFAYATPDGKWWGSPYCTDFFDHVMRVDLMSNPKEQQAFERQYGYPILPFDPPTKPDAFPATWAQVRDLAEFFTRPDEKIFGAYYFRDQWYSNVEFYIRFYELGGLFFDNKKDITIDSPQYRKALEDMKALTPFMDPVTQTCAWPCQYPDYAAGKVFQTIVWGSLNYFGVLFRAEFGKNNPELGIKNPSDAFGTYGMPGYVVGGKLIRTTVFYDQYSLMVGKHGKLTRAVPDLPYLFMQWFSDPEISFKALSNPGAIPDGWRTGHFAIEHAKAYPVSWPPIDPTASPPRRGALETFEVDQERAVPPLRISGLKQFQDLLGSNHNAYFSDRQDIDTTASKVQSGFESIVNRFGRDRVFDQWREVVRAFPPVLKEMHRDYIASLGA